MITDKYFDAGIRLRQAMWGPGAVDQVYTTTEANDKLQEIVTRFCFGDVWQREELDLKQRSLITVAMLIALNRPQELRIHMEGALANGATEVELREVALHAVLYAGIPAGVGGIRTLEEILAQSRPDSPLRAAASRPRRRRPSANGSRASAGIGPGAENAPA
jgi:4-carboxymuconolactone decarboxylase